MCHDRPLSNIAFPCGSYWCRSFCGDEIFVAVLHDRNQISHNGTVACSLLIAVTCGAINRVSPEIVQSIRLDCIFTPISLLVIIHCHGQNYFIFRHQ